LLVEKQSLKRLDYLTDALGNPQWKTPSFEELMVLEWIEPVKHFAQLQGIMANRMRQFAMFFVRSESKAWENYVKE
jgi:hypothetical protein